MKKLLIGASLSALLLTAGVASAASMKIGVLNMHNLMQKSPQAVKIRSEIKAKFGPKEQQIQALVVTLKKQTSDLYKNGAVMSASKRATLKQQITKNHQQLQMLQEHFSIEANTAQRKAFAGFLTLINKDVKQVAMKDGYNLIMLNNGIPYYQPQFDVTNEVLALMKKQVS